jgi:hypothetical protein
MPTMNPFRCASFPLLAAVALAGLLAACSSSPQPTRFALSFTLDEALQGTSLQVDVIGANAVSDLPKWETYSVTEYWQPGNVSRRDADKATLEFGRGRSNTQVLPATDPKWNDWLRTGALYVVVLVDLPGVPVDRQGNADPRRLILPLDRNQWRAGTNVIEVLIQESGVRLLTAKKA